MTTENDILVAIAEAREDAALEATAKALAEGEARGEARGRAEGIAEGEARGSAAKQKEIARAMLAKNTPVDFIASVTGLTKAQVQAIARAL